MLVCCVPMGSVSHQTGIFAGVLAFLTLILTVTLAPTLTLTLNLTGILAVIKHNLCLFTYLLICASKLPYPISFLFYLAPI